MTLLRRVERRLDIRGFGQLWPFLMLQLGFLALVAGLQSFDYFVNLDHLLPPFLNDFSYEEDSRSHAFSMARLLWDNLEF